MAAPEPPKDQEPPEYLQRYSHEDSERHFKFYFAVFQHWGTPAQLDRLLRLVGTPDHAERLLEQFIARAERWEWNRQFWITVKEGLLWLGYGAGALGFVIAARALWIAFTAGFTP